MRTRRVTYEVDQSGKIEQTERDTVIACVNTQSKTIFIKKKDKRALQQLFKTASNQRSFTYLTFSALLAILLSDLKPKHKIIIDREYLGHEKFIKEKLELYLGQLGIKNLPPITFGHVGKLSKAHKLAYLTAIKKQKPSLTVGVTDVMKVILGTKKAGVA